MSNEYSDVEIPADELKSLIETANWVPFTAELREKFNAFEVTSDNPLFAENDGLYMVRNNRLVTYISSNGAYWGDFFC